MPFLFKWSLSMFFSDIILRTFSAFLVRVMCLDHLTFMNIKNLHAR
jgi:hypothetical protein